MAHSHFCDVGGHRWECHGSALRPLAGDKEPSICMCADCQVPMEQGDHRHCTLELVACPEHVHEEQQIASGAEEFLRTPAGIHLAELFARRDSLAEDDPELDAIAAEILRCAFEAMAEGMIQPEQEQLPVKKDTQKD